MRILVLDDDDIRHQAFARRFINHSVVHAMTVDEACDALNKEKFDLVHLDHDLNDHGHRSVAASMYGQVELTGFDVARFIARDLTIDNRPDRVVIHSWNPPGAKMMAEILRDADISVSYEPFSVVAGDTEDLLEEFDKQ